METTCEISGEKFEVSDHEIQLRKKFGFGDSLPDRKPKYRFQQLGAFWPHWNLHKRKCDKTGKHIISVFRPDCPYPVWKRSEWFDAEGLPSAEFDLGRPFFEQAWELFQNCPLPHVFESHNQNCEYTDDWYYSKNCYLGHSGEYSEDCHYCYACDHGKNIHYGNFVFYSDLCFDLVNSKNCFNSLYILDCKNASDSAFLYDCRDCSNCMFCFNLRNKSYCFGNKQYTKEEFEKKKAEWDLSSRKAYKKAAKFFAEMMLNMAWHRALHIDQCENSSGNFMRECKDCENCYLLSKHENCAHTCFSGPDGKGILDSLGTIGGELTFMTSLPVYSYMVVHSFSISHCKFVEYSAYLQNCHYCFGCCGLTNKKYCIFNKQYSEADYKVLQEKIIVHMKETKEWGVFFPGYFAPNPYEESFSGFRFPLDDPEEHGYRKGGPAERKAVKTAGIDEIPDSYKDLDTDEEKRLSEQIFWDDKYQRSFQVTESDIKFAKRIKGPLPDTYYVHHMQDLLKWMPFNGELRETRCSRSGKKIMTNWPEEYDGRILCEEEYLNLVK